MKAPHIPVALTIAGSDSSGGAGIQADLKTFSALGVYGSSAITAITAQNTLGVRGVHAIPSEMVAAQIAAVVSDLPVGAIKLGMLFSAEIAAATADQLATAPHIPVVLDPVMIATSGDRLMQDDAVEIIIARLFPRAALITPNLSEAAFLARQPVARNEAEMEAQGRLLLKRGAQAVLIKGGHGTGAESVDLLVRENGVTRFSSPRIATINTHGTGCTLSAAIAAKLAWNTPLEEAIRAAKTYLSGAILAAQDWKLGHGAGPVQHFYALWPKDETS